jgi:hypothetical protein
MPGTGTDASRLLPLAPRLVPEQGTFWWNRGAVPQNVRNLL